MAVDPGQWDGGKWVSGGGPKLGTQGESVRCGEGSQELLGHGMRPGVHGAYGKRRGGRPRGFIRGLMKVFQGAGKWGTSRGRAWCGLGTVWRAGGAPRGGACRGGALSLSSGVGHPAVLRSFLALLCWGRRSLAVHLLRSLGFPAPSKWVPPLGHW